MKEVGAQRLPAQGTPARPYYASRLLGCATCCIPCVARMQRRTVLAVRCADRARSASTVSRAFAHIAGQPLATL